MLLILHTLQLEWLHVTVDRAHHVKQSTLAIIEILVFVPYNSDKVLCQSHPRKERKEELYHTSGIHHLS